MRALIRLAFCLFVGTAGCAAVQNKPFTQGWAPTDEQWEAVRSRGEYLNRGDGSRIFLRGEVINAALSAKADMEKASGVKAGLAVVESTPNTYTTTHNGRPVVALSLSFLDRFWQDPDALATTIAHELAHIKLGHSLTKTSKEEERTADEHALIWAAAAGYDPCGMARALLVLQGEGYWPSHPSYASRSELASEYAKKAGKAGC